MGPHAVRLRRWPCSSMLSFVFSVCCLGWLFPSDSFVSSLMHDLLSVRWLFLAVGFCSVAWFRRVHLSDARFLSLSASSSSLLVLVRGCLDCAPCGFLVRVFSGSNVFWCCFFLFLHRSCRLCHRFRFFVLDFVACVVCFFCFWRRDSSMLSDWFAISPIAFLMYPVQVGKISSFFLFRLWCIVVFLFVVFL